MKKSTRNGQSPDAHTVNKNPAALQEQPLLMPNPHAALPLLSLIAQVQLSIEDLLGNLSLQLMEQLLMMGTESVAGNEISLLLCWPWSLATAVTTEARLPIRSMMPAKWRLAFAGWASM